MIHNIWVSSDELSVVEPNIKLTSLGAVVSEDQQQTTECSSCQEGALLFADLSAALPSL